METRARSLLPIGRFAQLAGISVSALRFYADAGLLTPTLVDPDSGYRYYAPTQLALAERIKTLRAVEMPLDEIAVVLQPDQAEATRVLTAHEQRLYDRFQQQRAALGRMAELLRGRHEFPTLEIRERRWPEQAIVSVRGQAEPEDFWPFYQAARAELLALLTRENSRADGPDFVLYDADYLGGPLRAEVCLPVQAPLPVSGRVRFSVMPTQRAVCAPHPGDWHSYGQTYGAIYTWLEDRRLLPVGASYTLNHPDGGTELGFLLA